MAAAIVRISGARTVRAVEQADLAVREHHIQPTITGFEMPESMVREIVTMAMVRRPSPMGLPVYARLGYTTVVEYMGYIVAPSAATPK